jgi:hypothetical protein
MRNPLLFIQRLFCSVTCFFLTIFSTVAQAQQTQISDYVIFGRDAVQIGSSINISGGSIGSKTLVQTTGNATISSSIYSGGRVTLTNSNVVNGRITAADSANLKGTTLSVGSSALLGGNIDVKGNIVIGGGTVSGIVTHPPGTTYSGPQIGSREVIAEPGLPTLPVLLPVTDISSYPILTNNINATLATGPGNYGNINFGGNKTLTLNRPGIYVFNSIKMTGNSNKLVFNFDNVSSGNYFIYIRGNADFGKLDASLTKGGSASRIYVETQGDGITTSVPGNSFVIANGSSGGGSKWLGTVWAPNAGINIGSGTGSSNLTGTLYSATQVSMQSGVSLIYAPFTFCNPPNANAGIDKPLDFSPQTTLTGSSTTSGVSYSWQAINGGIITSSPNSSSITVSVSGSYILTVTSASNCFAQDTVVVSSRLRSIIGSELQSIYDNRPVSSPFFILSTDSVMIDVIVKDGKYNEVLNLLQGSNYGLDITPFGGSTVISNGTSTLIITGKFPIANLPKLNLLSDLINFCRPYYQAVNYLDSVIPNDNPVITGLVTSAGDVAMRTNLVRKGYNIDGDGTKLGIISNSYATIHAATTATQPYQPITYPPNPIQQIFTTNTAAQGVLNGDLPGDTTFSWSNPSHVVNPNGYTKNVHVLKDFPVTLSDEGRAMAEISHDVAPGAELYFRTGFFTANDCAIGIKELKDAGCKIIVDDITYITEPFFKDGVIANAVNAVANEGVSYFSAAGNFANKSYEKDFNPLSIPAGPFAGKMAHNFGGSDMFQKVRLAPGDYTIVFQWVDDIYSFGETAGTQYDIDGYLTPNTDGTSLFGYNRDNTGGDPIEFIPFTIPPGPDSIDANIFIVNNTITGNPLRIKYIIFRGGVRIMEYNEGNSTLVGQANAVGAIAVGAARFDKVPPYLNLPLAESFSSIGGTKTNGEVRNKPDLVAPDGVNTTVRLGQDYPNTALDGYSNFFGTSAAAPHAAAAAALIIEGRKKFLGQAITTPSEIRALMQSKAVDMATPGFDYISGYGFVNIDLTMRSFAAPTPSINQLVIPVTSPITIPGNSVFTVTVKGENFSTNSILYFNDSALASTTILDTINGIATAVIPQFTGNPSIRMYTPPYPTTNGLDGGFSNTLHFFDGAITVTAVNAIKKYGQQLPFLDTVIKINGVLLQDTTVTLASLGLSSLTVTTTATFNSDVGTYLIRPSRIFDENNPADVAFLQKYSYTFANGTLTVEKLPLKVTPLDKTVTYGQQIGNIDFKYEFDPTNIPNATALLNLIKTHHQAFVPNNALAVINGFSKTQVNGSVLTSADLLNLNMIASFNAVKNSRKFQVDNNNELVPLSNQNTFNVQYLVDVASESIFNYKTNSSAPAKFFSVYPGINAKAVLSAAALNSNTAKVEVNGSLVQMVNGSLVQMVNAPSGPMVPLLNGSLVQIVNGELSPVSNGSLVQLVNGSLVQLVNGEFVPIANGSLVQLVNGTVIKQISNGSLVQLVNGVETPIITNVTDITAIPNGSLVQLVNGSLVQMVNGSLVQLVNGSLVQLVNGSLVQLVNGSLVQLVNGSTLGLRPNSTNNTAVIIDETDVNAQQANWLGAMFGINMITGLEAGTQWIVPGVLVNSNFDISYGIGKATILNNPCLITHTPDKNFGSSANPGTPTSLWMTLVTKVSGQLKAKGDYLLFKSGTVSFNSIASTPAVTDLPMPTGKIVADNVSVPFTKYDAATNTWTTKVPIGFSSTSDIFVTGVIINSSTGFVKNNNNASSTVKGIFYSNKTFKDQWAYATAAYQPQFTYASVADSGQVTSINGNYKAGTPTTQVSHLVDGGSGGGGNNYTGNTNSYDKFTACSSANSPSANRIDGFNQQENQDNLLKDEFHIMPNPASNYVTVSFGVSRTGNSTISLFTIDGKNISEINNGISQAGKNYQKKIDVSNLPGGVYIILLRSGEKISIQKLIISK